MALRYTLGAGKWWGFTTPSIGIDPFLYQNQGGNLIFKRPQYCEDIRIFYVKQFVSLKAGQLLSSLFPMYQKKLRDKELAFVRDKQNKNLKALIEVGQNIDKDYDSITLSGSGGKVINATDTYGSKVSGALFLSYELDSPITVEWKTYHNIIENGYTLRSLTTIATTTTMYFMDIAPKISVHSGKNLVCTTVQGRDYTRKELVGGGDITFTVNGEINSNMRGVYPANDVQKFIQIMQYNGIINVKNLIFGQFNVERIIIKDYNLSNPEFNNIQPYSFTCVAVEPDEDVIVTKDTITKIDYSIEVQDRSGWYKFILDNKWSQISGGLTDTIAGAATSGVSIGLDALTNLI